MTGLGEINSAKVFSVEHGAAENNDVVVLGCIDVVAALVLPVSGEQAQANP